MVRVAAIFCEVLRDRFVDCTDVAGVRISSQLGRVTVTLTECSLFDERAGRRRDCVKARRLDSLAADESVEVRR